MLSPTLIIAFCLFQCFAGGAVLVGLLWLRERDRHERDRQAAQQRGVYCIMNTMTGAKYIGATSQSFAARWQTHIFHLNAGSHDNPLLQRDWHMFGADAFTFTVVEAIEDTARIWNAEVAYIKSAADALPPHLRYNRRATRQATATALGH